MKSSKPSYHVVDSEPGRTIGAVIDRRPLTGMAREQFVAGRLFRVSPELTGTMDGVAGPERGVHENRI
ncbi:hypothetical protein DMJ13_05480 [halophilic archaeon]|nr:hypothetical protein DMJ13_05480 [halophilic archaeon]